MDHLLPASFFAWCHETAIADWINTSVWAFAIIETCHIIGLTVLLGTIIVVNLRLLGFGRRRQSAAELAREVAPYALGSLALLIITGVPMFMSQAIKYSHSISFLFKMVLLLSALVLHSTIYNKATAPSMNEGARLGKLGACLSLMFWLGIALAGRGIAFLP